MKKQPNKNDPVSRTGKEPRFSNVPDAVAVAAIQGKAAMLPSAFRTLLPELRARAFTVAGVQDMAALGRLHKKVAEVVTKGREWKTVRGELADELEEFLGGGAEARAQLLLRTHGFQAYATARHQEQTAQADVCPWWQYVTAGDASVRASHAALDGRVFAHDDSFWGDHYPPWDFGCRCIVIACLPEEVEAMRGEDAKLPPVARRVLEGDALEAARKGLVSEGVGKMTPLDINVTPTADGGERPVAYKWNPTHQQMRLADIQYPPEILNPFVERWKQTPIGDGRTVYDWLTGKAAPVATPVDAPQTPARGSRGRSPSRREDMTPATFQPQGKPVADGISNKAANSAIRNAAQRVMDAIARVHGDGDLPRIPLQSGLCGKANGEYIRTIYGNATGINIKNSGAHPHMTVAHEIGHFLDHKGIAPHRSAQGMCSQQRGVNADMDALVDALRGSRSAREIQGKKPSEMRESFKEYALRDRELFARAYAQYIATNGGDEKMKAELKLEQNSDSWYLQWSDTDFAPINTAMAKLFKGKQWIK